MGTSDIMNFALVGCGRITAKHADALNNMALNALVIPAYFMVN